MATGEIKKFQGRASQRYRVEQRTFQEELSYKDILAKSNNFPEPVDNVDPILGAVARELATMRDCGNMVLQAVCEEGAHEYGKVLRCGREWCDTCGRVGSEAHMRRYSRLMPRIQQIESMGFLVIQWPIVARSAMRSRAVLTKKVRAIVRWLKRKGFDRGIRAWDWFGDPRCPVHHVPGEHQRESGLYLCEHCGQDKLFDVGDVLPSDMEWNPHLNILIEAGWLDVEELRAGLRQLLHEPGLIVHYEYSDEIPSKLHWARYAVKPTFHAVDWDLAMVPELIGFRSVFYWGKWDSEEVWSLDDSGDKSLAIMTALEASKCPECGSGLKWGGIRHLRELVGAGFLCEELGAGYWRIDKRRKSS